MEQSALEYNTERNELIIPEYGRHIQKNGTGGNENSRSYRTKQYSKGYHSCHGKYEPSPKRCT